MMWITLLGIGLAGWACVCLAAAIIVWSISLISKVLSGFQKKEES